MPEMDCTFGVITGCHPNDYFMVKATCASVRYFMPSTPLCVIADGQHDLTELERVYDAKVIRISELKMHGLNQLLTGSSKSKLAGLWHGPFESFIWLDSDAIVWGNVRSRIDLSDCDWNVFVEYPWNPDSSGDWDANRSWINHYFYDIKGLEQIDPAYEWRRRPYASAGTFAARKNAIPVDDFLAAEAVSSQYPGLFKFMDQGMLTYLLHRNHDAGRLKLRIKELQVIPVVLGREKVCQRLGWSGHLPNPDDAAIEPAIVHFCGQKPFVQSKQVFSAPFTAFRYLHYHKFCGLLPIVSWWRVLIEEATLFAKRLRRRVVST